MTYVSPHVEDLLGYPASQWLEQTGFVYTITHPDDRQALRGENERTEALGARFSRAVSTNQFLTCCTSHVGCSPWL